jgi:hypothetical protein
VNQVQADRERRRNIGALFLPDAVVGAVRSRATTVELWGWLD